MPIDTLEFLEKLDFIKVDVEGAELEVIRGATRPIEKDRPRILVECHERENAAWIDTWLDRIGYNVNRIHGGGYEPGKDGWENHIWLDCEKHR